MLFDHVIDLMFICLQQIEERHDVRPYVQVEVRPNNIQTETQAMNIQSNYSKCFDDDGRLKRTGQLYFNIKASIQSSTC